MVMKAALQSGLLKLGPGSVTSTSHNATTTPSVTSSTNQTPSWAMKPAPTTTPTQVAPSLPPKPTTTTTTTATTVTAPTVMTPRQPQAAAELQRLRDSLQQKDSRIRELESSNRQMESASRAAETELRLLQEKLRGAPFCLFV